MWHLQKWKLLFLGFVICKLWASIALVCTIRVCPLPPLVFIWDTDPNHLIHLYFRQPLQCKVLWGPILGTGAHHTTYFLSACSSLPRAAALPTWGHFGLQPPALLCWWDRQTDDICSKPARGPREESGSITFCCHVHQVAAQNKRNRMQPRYKKRQ